MANIVLYLINLFGGRIDCSSYTITMGNDVNQIQK